jgi:peptide/nickel transport system substrate-binding protein
VYRILLNQTDPNKENSSGERSSVDVPHPFFSDANVRQAFALAIDRDSLAASFGPLGRPVTNNLVTPPQYNSPNIFYKYDPEKAKALLEESGWIAPAGDTIRQKNGVKLKVVLQSYSGADVIFQNVNTIKKNLEAVGVEVELKLKDISIMFGAPCASNPDSTGCFNADMMYFYFRMASSDPGAYLTFWTFGAMPQKANNWSGDNLERWCNPAYDKLLELSKTEVNPEERAKLFIKMNDMLIENVVMIPTVLYADVLGVSPTIQGVDLTPWDAYTWNISDWRQVP